MTHTEDLKPGVEELKAFPKWMNTFIMPHELIGVSIYEDDHPNLSEVINCTLVHSATWKNEQPKKISETVVIPKDLD
jgi:hypothetical protein